MEEAEKLYVCYMTVPEPLVSDDSGEMSRLRAAMQPRF